MEIAQLFLDVLVHRICHFFDDLVDQVTCLNIENVWSLMSIPSSSFKEILDFGRSRYPKISAVELYSANLVKIKVHGKAANNSI
jgi:hypothetical protein